MIIDYIILYSLIYRMIIAQNLMRLKIKIQQLQRTSHGKIENLYVFGMI